MINKYKYFNIKLIKILVLGKIKEITDNFEIQKKFTEIYTNKTLINCGFPDINTIIVKKNYKQNNSLKIIQSSEHHSEKDFEESNIKIVSLEDNNFSIENEINPSIKNLDENRVKPELNKKEIAIKTEFSPNISPKIKDIQYFGMDHINESDGFKIISEENLKIKKLEEIQDEENKEASLKNLIIEEENNTLETQNLKKILSSDSFLGFYIFKN